KTNAENRLVEFAEQELNDFDVHEFRQIQDNLDELKEVIPDLKAAYDEELHLTLKNAYVMPAKLRDIAGEFLETQQKDFKIGFFYSKKKTEEVREQKL